MIGHIDIENSKTKKIITLDLPVIKLERKSEVIFDISNITQEEKDILLLAINDSTEFNYTDIEMFFIDDEEIPNYGPDYNYRIEDNKLVLNYSRENIQTLEEKNEDWTYNYENEFILLAKCFLNNKRVNYMIVYYDNGLKAKYIECEPGKNIFMKMFFEDGYKAIALFKKNDKIANNIRENLIYINSYSELDELKERRF